MYKSLVILLFALLTHSSLAINFKVYEDDSHDEQRLNVSIPGGDFNDCVDEDKNVSSLEELSRRCQVLVFKLENGKPISSQYRCSAHGVCRHMHERAAYLLRGIR